MKILYFHQYFKTPDGAGGTRSYEMGRYFAGKGHSVTMVYLKSDDAVSPIAGDKLRGTRRGSVEGIDLIEFDLRYSNKLSFARRTWVFIRYSLKCIRLIFTEKYDLVFATSTPLTAGIPGIIMKMAGRRIPFVFEVRDLWPELPRAMGVIRNRFVLWMMDKLESLSYNKADACIALSPGIEKGIRFKLRKDKLVYMIPNGCDLELFKPGTPRKDIIPGAEQENLVAVFTGAHGFANGLDSALDAASLLMATPYRDKIKIVFIGDGIMKKHLVGRKEEEQLSNCIFINPLPKKQLTEMLKAADIGLMLLANVPAFYYGTSPNKFFDYISTGLPVFNNYPGWLADMITINRCGVVVPPDDPQTFAKGLIEIFKNRESLKEMGRNARDLAVREFDRNKLAEKLLSALNETLTAYGNKSGHVRQTL